MNKVFRLLPADGKKQNKTKTLQSEIQPLDVVISPSNLQILHVQPLRFELKVAVPDHETSHHYQGEEKIHLPEEDVVGLAAGDRMYQLLL